MYKIAEVLIMKRALRFKELCFYAFNNKVHSFDLVFILLIID